MIIKASSGSVHLHEVLQFPSVCSRQRTFEVRPQFLPFPTEALDEVPLVHAALPQSQDTGIPHL